MINMITRRLNNLFFPLAIFASQLLLAQTPTKLNCGANPVNIESVHPYGPTDKMEVFFQAPSYSEISVHVPRYELNYYDYLYFNNSAGTYLTYFSGSGMDKVMGPFEIEDGKFSLVLATYYYNGAWGFNVDNIEVKCTSNVPDDAWSAPSQFNFETPHPVPGNVFYRRVVKLPGATHARFHINKLETYTNYGFLSIRNAKTGQDLAVISEARSDFWTKPLPGDEFEIVFVSTYGNYYYGVLMDSYQWAYVEQPN